MLGPWWFLAFSSWMQNVCSSSSITSSFYTIRRKEKRLFLQLLQGSLGEVKLSVSYNHMIKNGKLIFPKAKLMYFTTMSRQDIHTDTHIYMQRETDQQTDKDTKRKTQACQKLIVVESRSGRYMDVHSRI